eukprot:142636-Pelagomonas_calceolata.AAC.1
MERCSRLTLNGSVVHASCLCLHMRLLCIELEPDRGLECCATTAGCEGPAAHAEACTAHHFVHRYAPQNRSRASPLGDVPARKLVLGHPPRHVQCARAVDVL